MKMKEIGIDWDQLQHGASYDLNMSKQTIKLGSDYLITHANGDDDDYVVGDDDDDGEVDDDDDDDDGGCC